MNENQHRKAHAIISTLHQQVDFVNHKTQPAWQKDVKRNLAALAEVLPNPDADAPPKSPEEIKEYLTEAVLSWRAHRDNPIVEGEFCGTRELEQRARLKKLAPYYIDAFQSAHVFFFGEPVPEEDKTQENDEG